MILNILAHLRKLEARYNIQALGYHLYEVTVLLNSFQSPIHGLLNLHLYHKHQAQGFKPFSSGIYIFLLGQSFHIYNGFLLYCLMSFLQNINFWGITKRIWPKSLSLILPSARHENSLGAFSYNSLNIVGSRPRRVRLNRNKRSWSCPNFYRLSRRLRLIIGSWARDIIFNFFDISSRFSSDSKNYIFLRYLKAGGFCLITLTL